VNALRPERPARPVRLVAEGVAVGYGAVPVLEGVDLELRAGEILVLLGPNGAGKTTLLRALGGTLAPTVGEIRFDGRPLALFARADVACAVAVVPQDTPAAHGFSVRAVVAMGRAPHQGRWMRASPEDDAVVEASLTRLGLAAMADRPFERLSGGERKRVLVAQALAQRTPVLLLDEPTASLDLRRTLELFVLLAEEAASGAAVVAIVHDLALAARVADRVALLFGGRVEALGAVDDVMTAPLLSRAFETEIARVVDDATGVRAFAPASPSPRASVRDTL
jgi:iron complex transport system ATP-binding protein